jgi:predicted nucleic acid binding AN1-type Zn finger protein
MIMGFWETIRTFIRGVFPKKKYLVYANCATCGENTYLPFTCPYCGDYFCGKHHLPFNHNCKNISEWKNQSAPSSGKK